MAAARGAADPRQRLPPSGDILTARVSALAALVTGTAAVIALHVLRPDLPPLSSRLSAYATGRYGGVMTLAFLALAVGVAAFAAGVWPRSRLVAVLSGVAGVGLLLCAVYPIGVSPAADAVHSVASTVATTSLTAAVVVDTLWRPALPRTLPAAGAAATLLVSPGLHTTAYSGLAQRVLWLLLIGSVAAAVPRAGAVGQPREPRAARHSKNMEYT